MKKKLFLLLALPFCWASSWAEDVTISSATELVAFASRVNGGETSLNATLTADIDLDGTTWTPIGNSTTAYAGTFNGGGFTISNFNYTATGTHNGLFGHINAATIQNFSINGSLTSSKNYTGVIGLSDGKSTIKSIHSSLILDIKYKGWAGGVVGGASANTTIAECIYDGTFDTHNYADAKGGIIGYAKTATIKNCIFSGEVKGEEVQHYGGILGYVANSGFGGVQNCLCIGDVYTTNSSPTGVAYLIGNINTNTKLSGITNNYFLKKEGHNYDGYAGALADAEGLESPHEVTLEQLASGEVTYKLNGNQSTIVFRQTIETEATPTLNSGSLQVYYIGPFLCDGVTPKQGVNMIYSNTSEPVIHDSHGNFVDGLCSICGYPEADYIAPNNGFYMIGNDKELRWFAAYVNQIDPTVNAKLTEEIDLNNENWTPIGFNGQTYTGTFDGGENKIKNFSMLTTADYSGFFGRIGNNAVIKDFSLEGSINSSHGYVGAVIGSAKGNVTISNIHSNVGISCSKSRHGGILGYQSGNGTINIDRCVYSGTLNAGNAQGNFGGMVGLTYSTNSAYINITNCLFDGKIINPKGTKDTNAGGIVGYSKTCHVIIKNCLSIGAITATFPGQFVGQINTESDGTPANLSFEEVNYYADGGSVQGTGTGEPKSGSTTPEPVDATRLASGEVAYKLGEAFTQVLGTDNIPTLDSSKPNVYKMTVGNAGYASFVPEVNIATLPTGVTAYVGQINGSSLHLEAVTALPADNAFIVNAAEGDYYYNNTSESVTLSETNDLQVATTDFNPTTENTIYCLAKKNGNVGFYPVATTVTIPARKVYLEIASGTAPVKGFYGFDDDDATGISLMEDGRSKMEDGAIYNVAGQRLNKMQKGINIVNGKKILK